MCIRDSTNNEWDRFITREEVITGLPAQVSSDLDTNQNATDFNGTHNQFGNWFYIYSCLLYTSRCV